MKAYVVGGFIRDGILGHSVNDIDIVVDSKAYSEFKKHLQSFWLSKGFKFIQNKEITLKCMRRNHCQLTTFTVQADHSKYELDVRELQTSIEKDALMRDFTINAIYIDLESLQIIDPVKGLDGITTGRIKCCELPKETFNQKVRTLRAVRISHKIGFGFSKRLQQFLKTGIKLKKEHLSPLMYKELDKIFKLDNWQSAIGYILTSNIASIFTCLFLDEPYS